jgi:glycosyltransferase involved in cell wall biosynthesis
MHDWKVSGFFKFSGAENRFHKDSPASNCHSKQRVGNIAFSWYGLPQYAARLLKAAIARFGPECIVLGSKPSVPVEGMEEILGDSLHWVEADKPILWSDLGLPVPRVFVQSGWAYPAFSTLGRAVKERDGVVIGLSDANWRGDLRQLVLGPIVFRALYRRKFDAMIVPGLQSARLMRYFGMPATRVRLGMYGADPALFNGGAELTCRPRTFLFVGQFIARKDVLGLANAFLKFSEDRPGWTLNLCGSGEQQPLIPRDHRIIVENFVQPGQLAERYRNARFFVLPSLVEAWGLVVHEASLCGCALVLSDAIGSADDLATSANAIRFRAGSERDLIRALHEAADFDDARLAMAEASSRTSASQFGPNRFADEVETLINELFEK